MGKEKELIVAISKGRVFDSVNSILKKSDFSIKDLGVRTRKILISSNSSKIKYLLVRGWDIPAFVDSGAAQLGILGKDIILERENYDFAEVADLQIGTCRLSVAGKNKEILKKPKLRVATRYVNSAKIYIESLGIQPEIIELLGSHEIAPDMNLSDLIIDLVETGKTLEENNLKELEVIRNISTRLIANKASLVTKKDLINQFKRDLLSRA